MNSATETNHATVGCDKIDPVVDSNPMGYCTECFREEMNPCTCADCATGKVQSIAGPGCSLPAHEQLAAEYPELKHAEANPLSQE